MTVGVLPSKSSLALSTRSAWQSERSPHRLHLQFLQDAQKQLIDEETFRRKINELNHSMSSLRSKRRLFLNNSQADQAIAEIKRLASVIDKGPDKITEFDEELFDSLVEDIVVDTSNEIKFKIIGGLVLKEAIERTHR